MTCGEKIGIAAEKKRMPLKKLAERADVNYGTLYMAVKRKNKTFNKDALERIADVLGVEISYFLPPTEGQITAVFSSHEGKELFNTIQDIVEPFSDNEKEKVLMHIKTTLNVLKPDIWKRFNK